MVGLHKELLAAHKRRNRLHSLLLIAGLAVLVAIPAYLVSGLSGVVIAGLAVAVFTTMMPGVPTTAVMAMYKARELQPGRDGGLLPLVQTLATRAELRRAPRVFIIPSATLNAFATGTVDNSAVAITQGLLSRLQPREIAGVLAHEISHIRNNDLKVMGLADVMSRLTLAMSYSGMILAMFNLMALLTGAAPTVSWLAILMLYAAPAVSSMLQLGLSRAREYDADLEGAMLTGDPEGLASALSKVERVTGRFWEDIVPPMPGRRMPQPSMLRTHPTTADRIARLRELALTEEPALAALFRQSLANASPFKSEPPRPRYHISGSWY